MEEKSTQAWPGKNSSLRDFDKISIKSILQEQVPSGPTLYLPQSANYCVYLYLVRKTLEIST